MIVSRNWLEQYITLDMTNDELVAIIGSHLGEVEESYDLAERYQSVVAAKVVSVAKHPDADKLTLVTIDAGKASKSVPRTKSNHIQVVCGAPNVVEDMLVAWLPPNSTVPETHGSDETFVLESREIRGEMSHGMLASPKELGLGKDHSGILEIDVPAEPGSSFADLYELNDFIIDIENKMFTRRPDCFGVLGVARELAAITGQQFESPDWYQTMLDITQHAGVDLPFTFEDQSGGLSKRFMLIAMDNVRVDNSPVITRSYLSRIGVKPINNIVDITNYVMHLTGQPLHAYDYDTVAKHSSGDEPVIIVRPSKKGETLMLLNGKEVTFEDDQTLVIATDEQPIGIAGIMGGADTEVGDHTTKILLESAHFDMYSIRRASMKHGLFTDAVTRFTKGQSPQQTDRVLAETVDKIINLEDAHVASQVADHNSADYEPVVIGVNAARVNQLLGTEIAAEDMQHSLEYAEFSVEREGDELHVTVPFWRQDLEVAEDIIEEVGRLYGYDNIPLVLPAKTIEPGGRPELMAFKKRLRQLLARAGANELLTYAFVHERTLTRARQDVEQAYAISNALSPDLQYYRLSIMPSLLEHVHGNIKAGHEPFALFEIGKTHTKKHADPVEKKLPLEIESTALVFSSKERSNSGAAYFDARRYLDYVAQQLGLEFVYTPIEKDPGFNMTSVYNLARAATVQIKGKDGWMGIVGEYHPQVAVDFKLPAHTAGFELSTLDLFKAAQHTSGVQYTPLPRYPAVEQDITLKVDISLPYAELSAALSAAFAKAKQDSTTVSVELVSIYCPDESETKNVTFSLSFVDGEKTLTTDETNDLIQAALDALKVKAQQV